MKKISFILSACCFMVFFVANLAASNTHVQKAALEFIENQGQWEDKIQMKSDFGNGDLWIEDGLMTFVIYDEKDIRRIHELKHGAKLKSQDDLLVDGHMFQMEFVEALEMKFEGREKKPNYYNYFLGKDRSKWASAVPAYEETRVEDVWKGIDYRLYSADIDLKYDFIVQPNADVNDIQLKFEHLENLYIENGNLYLETSVKKIIDLKPIAYQKTDAGFEYVECQYSLQENTIGFEFPNGYDSSQTLIIDPKLIFSSYSGSSRDNWGNTATFDPSGNLYAGGVARTGTGSYPTTTGAFQTSFGGGNMDMAISKFSSDGTSLIFSTYLGGNGCDAPHSLVVNNQGELIVMGTTSSNNYPTSVGAFDSTYNILGTNSHTIFTVFSYVGSDIVLTKFNASGTAIKASTYIGGSGFDGLNFWNSTLNYNYGDAVRGEVIVDQVGNCYVASTSASSNFPTTNNSSYRGGSQDAVVFKMDTSFSTMLWGRFLGGGGTDAAYSIQLDKNGQAVVGGGTNSNGIQTTSSALHPSRRGGVDGFVTCISANGSTITASTYLGTSSYDQVYFVQVDDSNYIYATGQTEGSYSIYPSSVYRNPKSGQFVHKLTNDLDSTKMSTVFGTGTSSTSTITVDISPSAFLVNQCGHIYVSGWGGPTNNLQASNSTTNGLPTTSGAYKTTTDGKDFYLIVLDRNADTLRYATFFGGSGTSGEHVDGGTSRFDKRGIVYQAVCAGCGGNNSFPTSPSNVYSTTNGSNNCNMGVIKFDLFQLNASIGLSGIEKVCIPGSVTFNNSSDGGTDFYWEFGDGDTSSAFEPTHIYRDTGDFTVMLVISDSLSCSLNDTSYINIRGEAPPVADIDSVPVLCPGDSIMLNATGGIKYQWYPSFALSNDTVSNPYASPVNSSSYMVVVGDSCGSDTNNLIAYDTARVDILVATDNTTASASDTVCKGDAFQLSASGGVSYTWVPSTFLNKNNISNPVATPNSSVSYIVLITDTFGCDWQQRVQLTVEDSLDPIIISSPDTVICRGDSALIYTTGGSHYRWYPSVFVKDSTSRETYVQPDQTTVFTVTVFGKCFTASDSVQVGIVDFQTEAMPDTFACPEVPLQLRASPGNSFKWYPREMLSDTNTFYPEVVITEDIDFIVEAVNNMGCKDFDTVSISLRNPPYVNAGDNVVIQANSTTLLAKGEGSFEWEPKDLVSCPTCPQTQVNVPNQSTTFIVKITDVYGCVNYDEVVVSKVPYAIYVPNSFTPNDDEHNPVFKVYGYNLEDFELMIYNRWGDQMFQTYDMEEGWDGTYNGEDATAGRYVYRLKYSVLGENFDELGSVYLVR